MKDIVPETGDTYGDIAADSALEMSGKPMPLASVKLLAHVAELMLPIHGCRAQLQEAFRRGR